MNPRRAPEQAFYRWVDGQGRLHVVSSLEDVPASERAKVEHLRVSGVDVVPGIGGATGTPWQPDWGSFGAGFGLALVLAWLYGALPNGLRWASRLAVIVGLVALLAGAYWGWVRKTAGLGAGSALAAPSALIQDARDAVEQVRASERRQAEEIRKIQAEGH